MAALHTEQLEFLLSHLVHSPGRSEALGVFAADCIPSLRRINARNTCFILNTDLSHEPGAHWLAFYYDHAKRCLEYFDSFGLPLSFHYNVSRELSKLGLRVTPMNTRGMLQRLDTTACGYYCILYLHFRALFTAEGAVRQIARLTRSTATRDAKVVSCVHLMMHEHHCLNMPTTSSCSSKSQGCKCRNE